MELSALALAVAAWGTRLQWFVYAKELATEKGMTDEEKQNLLDIVEKMEPGWWIFIVSSLKDYVEELGVKGEATGELMVARCKELCRNYLSDNDERMKLDIAYSFSTEYDTQRRMNDKKENGGNEDE